MVVNAVPGVEDIESDYDVWPKPSRFMENDAAKSTTPVMSFAVMWDKGADIC